MKTIQIYSILILICFSIVLPSSTIDENKHGFKYELKNQLIGGLTGSIIGSGIGFGLGVAQGGTIEGDRRIIPFTMFGNVIGNSLGHWIFCKSDHELPFLVSLGSGLLITGFLNWDPNLLDGDYYNSKLINDNDVLFVATLFWIQPLISYVSHSFWPKSKTTLSFSLEERNKFGLNLNRGF